MYFPILQLEDLNSQKGLILRYSIGSTRDWINPVRTISNSIQMLEINCVLILLEAIHKMNNFSIGSSVIHVTCAVISWPLVITVVNGNGTSGSSVASLHFRVEIQKFLPYSEHLRHEWNTVIKFHVFTIPRYRWYFTLVCLTTFGFVVATWEEFLEN